MEPKYPSRARCPASKPVSPYSLEHRRRPRAGNAKAPPSIQQRVSFLKHAVPPPPAKATEQETGIPSCGLWSLVVKSVCLTATAATITGSLIDC